MELGNRKQCPNLLRISRQLNFFLQFKAQVVTDLGDPKMKFIREVQNIVSYSHLGDISNARLDLIF